MPGDISFSSGTTWWGANLTAFVQNGTIAESRVNDMAERILASWYFLDKDKKYPEGEFFEAHPRPAVLKDHSELQRVQPERRGREQARRRAGGPRARRPRDRQGELGAAQEHERRASPQGAQEDRGQLSNISCTLYNMSNNVP